MDWVFFDQIDTKYLIYNVKFCSSGAIIDG